LLLPEDVPRIPEHLIAAVFNHPDRLSRAASQPGDHRLAVGDGRNGQTHPFVGYKRHGIFHQEQAVVLVKAYPIDQNGVISGIDDLVFTLTLVP